MKVRMLTLAAGPAGVWPAGQVVDVDPLQAKALLAGGYAEPAEPLVSLERATAEPVAETAVVPQAKKRKG